MSLPFVDELNLLLQHVQVYIKPWTYVLAALWAVNIVNWVIGSPLNYLGIFPRHVTGLIGIIFAPILHRNFTHLLFNSIPLFFLGLAILTADGPMQFYWVTLVVTVLGGFCIWLFARPGIHIGASSLISGYFGYILISAYRQPGLITILLAVLSAYYFGGIFAGLFPGKKFVSWEGHLFGFLAGILCAYLPNLL